MLLCHKKIGCIVTVYVTVDTEVNAFIAKVTWSHTELVFTLLTLTLKQPKVSPGRKFHQAFAGISQHRVV